jgi:predicted TIM-barrel fold metal-dependent hydrolase
MTDIGVINRRRLQTPGSQEWDPPIRLDAPNRHLVIAVDSHVSEPADFYEQGGIDARFYERLPRIVTDDEGRQYSVVDGFDRHYLLKGRPKPSDPEAVWEAEGLNFSHIFWSDRVEPDDLERMRATATQFCDEPTLSRVREDFRRDGVDGAVLFCNRGLVSFASYDHAFVRAMCHAFNVWADNTYGASNPQFAVAAMLATADIDRAIDELAWIKSQGFRAVTIPAKPYWGDNGADEITYNHPMYDRLWAAFAEVDLPICIHVGTGRDPRSSTGSGGALILKSVGFLQSAIEPLAQMLSSGVFERFPSLRLVTVEADFGWIPWLLESLDLAYYKHHMWVRPVMSEPPSHYWYQNCSASFIEDTVGLSLAKPLALSANIMWSNDYPHHEGTWPHSTEAIERQLQHFTNAERADILGRNAARVFRFDPEILLSNRTTPSRPD